MSIVQHDSQLERSPRSLGKDRDTFYDRRKGNNDTTLRRLDDVGRRRNATSVFLSMEKSPERIKIDLKIFGILLKKGLTPALETV